MQICRTHHEEFLEFCINVLPAHASTLQGPQSYTTIVNSMNYLRISSTAPLHISISPCQVMGFNSNSVTLFPF